MKLIEFEFPESRVRDTEYTIYPLGDVHIGAPNCAEKQFRRIVQAIRDDPNAYWFGGGDLVDAVILQDQKRFDPAGLPEWMLDASAAEVRANLQDIVNAQLKRLTGIVEPIRARCMGLIEGNHEYQIMKQHNRNITQELCNTLGVPALTDTCFMRLKFRRLVTTVMIRLYACHGHGGGRTPGSEPNHLARLSQDKECEILLRGHSHTQHIMPPQSRLTIPVNGKLGDECALTTLRAANWGCYLRTYAAGPSTYDSRANYPVRPLSTVRVVIRPFREIGGRSDPDIRIDEISMHAPCK